MLKKVKYKNLKRHLDEAYFITDLGKDFKVLYDNVKNKLILIDKNEVELNEKQITILEITNPKIFYAFHGINKTCKINFKLKETDIYGIYFNSTVSLYYIEQGIVKPAIDKFSNVELIELAKQNLKSLRKNTK